MIGPVRDISISSMRTRKLIVCLSLLAIASCLTTCHKEKPLPQQRYDLRGKVVAVDANAGTLTVAHQSIPGYMGAMTMSFIVKDQWAFNVLKPGQTVSATLVIEAGHSWLEGLVVTEEGKPGSDSLAPPGSVTSALGQEVPDLSLVNQDGKRIHLHQYHGKALLLTFIYTRCPLPDYCPLMSRNFAQIAEQVRRDPRLSASTHLLSISIDPEFDTPDVLRAYGRNYAGSLHPFDRWEFATGTPEEVRKVAEFFGLRYWTDRGQIVHSLVTVLIAPGGKVIQVYRGNDWQPAQVVSDLRNSESHKMQTSRSCPSFHGHPETVKMA